MNIFHNTNDVIDIFRLKNDCKTYINMIFDQIDLMANR